MEKYGNIGERNFIQRLGDATVGSGVDIVNAAMDGVDAYQDYNIKDGGAMNE